LEPALQIARELEDKTTELQATTGLSRLHAARGRRNEAREMLSKIYNWFTEGFDTADLKEAKILLEKLEKDPTAPADPNGPSLRRGYRQLRSQ